MLNGWFSTFGSALRVVCFLAGLDVVLIHRGYPIRVRRPARNVFPGRFAPTIVGRSRPKRPGNVQRNRSRASSTIPIENVLTGIPNFKAGCAAPSPSWGLFEGSFLVLDPRHDNMKGAAASARSAFATGDGGANWPTVPKGPPVSFLQPMVRPPSRPGVIEKNRACVREDALAGRDLTIYWRFVGRSRAESYMAGPASPTSPFLFSFCGTARTAVSGLG